MTLSLYPDDLPTHDWSYPAWILTGFGIIFLFFVVAQQYAEFVATAIRASPLVTTAVYVSLGLIYIFTSLFLIWELEDDAVFDMHVQFVRHSLLLGAVALLFGLLSTFKPLRDPKQDMASRASLLSVWIPGLSFLAICGISTYSMTLVLYKIMQENIVDTLSTSGFYVLTLLFFYPTFYRDMLGKHMRMNSCVPLAALRYELPALRNRIYAQFHFVFYIMGMLLTVFIVGLFLLRDIKKHLSDDGKQSSIIVSGVLSGATLALAIWWAVVMRANRRAGFAKIDVADGDGDSLGKPRQSTPTAGPGSMPRKGQSYARLGVWSALELFKAVKQKLRDEGIQLWLPPFTNSDGSGSVPIPLVMDFCRELGSAPDTTRDVLEHLRQSSFERKQRKLAGVAAPAGRDSSALGITVVSKRTSGVITNGWMQESTTDDAASRASTVWQANPRVSIALPGIANKRLSTSTPRVAIPNPPAQGAPPPPPPPPPPPMSTVMSPVFDANTAGSTGSPPPPPPMQPPNNFVSSAPPAPPPPPSNMVNFVPEVAIQLSMQPVDQGPAPMASAPPPPPPMPPSLLGPIAAPPPPPSQASKPRTDATASPIPAPPPLPPVLVTPNTEGFRPISNLQGQNRDETATPEPSLACLTPCMLKSTKLRRVSASAMSQNRRRQSITTLGSELGRALQRRRAAVGRDSEMIDPDTWKDIREGRRKKSLAFAIDKFLTIQEEDEDSNDDFSFSDNEWDYWEEEEEDDEYRDENALKQPLAPPGCTSVALSVAKNEITRTTALKVINRQPDRWIDEITQLFADHFFIDAKLVSITIVAATGSGYMVTIVLLEDGRIINDQDLKTFFLNHVFANLHPDIHLTVNQVMHLAQAATAKPRSSSHVVIVVDQDE
eukprot:m.211720 g.211720  ORF g.211720 m.211720 type:complete len:887 (-) comp10747_c0_seq5:2847-5507(-)